MAFIGDSWFLGQGGICRGALPQSCAHVAVTMCYEMACLMGLPGYLTGLLSCENRGWTFFVALPFTMFTVFAAIRDELLPAEVAERLKLPAIIEDHFPTFLVAQPWYVWALATEFVLILLILDGSYRVAAREAHEKATIDARLNSMAYARAQLEFIFDESNGRCVKDEFYWFNDKPPKSRRWFVGIKNSLTTKSADDVTIRALESWFVSNTIAEAHRRIDQSIKP
jgi:hypothetical protein